MLDIFNGLLDIPMVTIPFVLLSAQLVPMNIRGMLRDISKKLCLLLPNCINFDSPITAMSTYLELTRVIVSVREIRMVGKNLDTNLNIRPPIEKCSSISLIPIYLYFYYVVFCNY